MIVNSSNVLEIRLCEDEYWRSWSRHRCRCDDAKGAHVANALRVDAGIGVSKIYTKRALRDATGHAKAFREAFTKIDCLINYLSTIPHPADEVSITEVMGPNEEDARYHVNLEKCTRGCTYWQSIGIACKHAMAVWEMYQSQLKATGEEISQARHNAARFVRWYDTTRHLSTARSQQENVSLLRELVRLG